MRRLVVTAAVAAGLTAICVAWVDQPVARAIASADTWPALWDSGIAGLEYAAGIEPWKWTGVIVLVAGVVATQLRWRRYAYAWLLVASTHLVCRNLMLPLKTLTGRLRPHEWLAHPGGTFGRGGIAFPSGHVMLFASLVVPFVVAVPRARWLLGIVGFVMIARVATDAHFVSDVLAGLAVVCAVTALCEAAARRWSPRPPASPR